MKILYGTSNPGKLEGMRQFLLPLGIELIGLCDLDEPIPDVDESGANPLDNAVIKAKAFYEAFHMPVFSCDSGLFFDGLDESLQPGTHVRRVNGRQLTDEEMIAHYASFSAEHGGKLVARYQNAVCFIYDEQHIFSSMSPALSYLPFLLVDKPHPKRIKGFPLDSLSADIKTGKYYLDEDYKSEFVDQIDQGFRDFFSRCFEEIQGR